MKYYLTRLGWQMSRHAMIQVSHFIQINLLTASPAVLLDWTVKEWQSTLLQLHSDRQGWKGLPPISRRDTIQVIAQFQPHQQKQILNEIAGAFQTHCQQSVWNSEVTEECNLCGQIDTRYHRVFTCAATQQVRDEFAGTMTALLDIGTEWHELPVIFEHEADDMHRTIHATWPEPDIPFQMFQQLQLIDHQPHELSFYTDGSCLHPTLPTCRYSGFAIVIDLAATDAQRLDQVSRAMTGHKVHTLAPLVSTRTPGAQNIYRAELFAITYIVERFQHTCIHTDSQAALDTSAHILHTASVATLEHLPEFDLVQRLWTALQTGRRRFNKVTAHAEAEIGIDPITRYHRLGNKLDNDCAIIAKKEMFSPFATALSAVAMERKYEHALLYQLFQFHLAAFAHRAILHAQATDEQHEAEDATRQRQDVRAICSNYSLTQVWKIPPAGHLMIQASAWGPTLAKDMLTWMRSFQWPVQPSQHELQSAGVTWYKLVISFMLFTGVFFPLRCSGDNGTEILLVAKSDAEIQALNFKFSDFANTFSMFYKQICDLIQYPVWPVVERGLVRSMYLQGSSCFTSGFLWRPVFPCQDRVATLFKAYHQRHKGPAFTEVPALGMIPNLTKTKAIQRELTGSWVERSKRFSQASKQMRMYRKNPMPSLQFNSDVTDQ